MGGDALPSRRLLCALLLVGIASCDEATRSPGVTAGDLGVDAGRPGDQGPVAGDGGADVDQGRPADAAAADQSHGDPARECVGWQTAHPDWVLCDDFESGAIDETIWNDSSGDNQVVGQPVFAGNHALAMRHPADTTGGWMNSIWYPRGYTSLHDHGFAHLFLRWYGRFSPGFASSTKIAGFTVRASDLDSFWDGSLGAGFKPDGRQNGGGTRVVTSLGQGDTPPGQARFYTYHRRMMLDRWTDGGGQLSCAYFGDATPAPPGWQHTDSATDPAEDYYCAAPGTDPWNELSNLLSGYDPGTYLAEDLALPREQWRCLELELAVNTAGQDDGVLRLWLDDRLVGEWVGARFAESGAQMQIHALQLTASSPDDHPEQFSYYDNVVVSTRRIGCF